MIFTLDNCMSRINQVLNYPMLEYTDIQHYFDQAISELNTTLRVGIKPLSAIVQEHAHNSIEDYSSVNLTDYFPIDVINLYLIPYVCFKFTVRNGGDGSIFVDEFTQGFQQIQTSYDIPNFVVLSEQAGKLAYAADVEENLSNLNIKIPTRAIYDSMKIGDSFMPTYGGMYDNGGWGI